MANNTAERGPERILVVDDDPNIVRLIELYLKRQGYLVVTAGSGNEALILCERQDFSLAILDVMMPGMDGLEVCRVLRERARTLNLPIIMLSALNQVQDKIKGLRAGSDEYVTKPVDLEELGVRVAVLLERTRRLMQSRPAALGKVFGFIGAKGGVGTTTVLLNVASALALLKKPTAAVEFRQGYGSFAHQFKTRPRANLGQLAQLDPQQIDDRQVRACLNPSSAGFHVLFGPQDPSEYHTMSAGTAEAIVRQVASLADYTLLDLANYPTEAAQAAVGLCNLAVVVLEGEPGCLHAARATVDLLHTWGLSGGMICALLVNRSGLTLSLNMRDIKAQLECEVLGTVPRATEVCLAMQERGTTLVASRSEHLATTTLVDMTNRLIAEPLVGVRM
jgi:DNA-binding response OmpR family regulator